MFPMFPVYPYEPASTLLLQRPGYPAVPQERIPSFSLSFCSCYLTAGSPNQRKSCAGAAVCIAEMWGWIMAIPFNTVPKDMILDSILTQLPWDDLEVMIDLWCSTKELLIHVDPQESSLTIFWGPVGTPRLSWWGLRTIARGCRHGHGRGFQAYGQKAFFTSEFLVNLGPLRRSWTLYCEVFFFLPMPPPRIRVSINYCQFPLPSLHGLL